MTLLLMMSLVTQVYSDTSISIPIIYSDHPGNHSLLTGDNITLQCQISNWNKDDKYSVSWFRYLLNTSSILLNIFEMKKKIQIFTYRHGSDSRHQVTRMRDSNHQLIITNIRVEQSGFYSCKVKNRFGGAVSTGFISVEEKLSSVDVAVTVPYFALKTEVLPVIISTASLVFIFFILIFILMTIFCGSTRSLIFFML